jgi:hypothetical protein
MSKYSKFYYGQNVGPQSFAFDLDEGSGELQVTIPIGSYTLSEIVTELSTQLNSVGNLDYTVAVNRATRVVTISATGTFSILRSSGSRSGEGVYNIIGFTGGTDLTGFATYTGASPSGFEYTPQFWLQDYIPSENFREFIDATVNEASSGEIEVVRFGIRNFMQCNLKYNTNISQPSNGPFLNNSQGVANLRSFMEYVTEKFKVEFMFDRDTPNVFEKFILESTPQDKNGLSFQLKELYDQSLPGYFDTGILRFRKVL